MTTRTIHLGGETITVTRHEENDFDIYFNIGDFSVRGTMLDIVKTFAEWQASVLDEPVVSFAWLDRTISNPWIDPSARFPLDSQQSADTYGIDNVLQFIIDACAILRPTDTEEA